MKLARLPVSDVFLAEILKGQMCGPLTTNAPQDLRVHGVVPNPGQPWTLTLIVESETFAEIEGGGGLPEVVFHYTRLTTERPSCLRNVP